MPNERETCQPISRRRRLGPRRLQRRRRAAARWGCFGRRLRSGGPAGHGPPGSHRVSSRLASLAPVCGGRGQADRLQPFVRSAAVPSHSQRFGPLLVACIEISDPFALGARAVFKAHADPPPGRLDLSHTGKASPAATSRAPCRPSFPRLHVVSVSARSANACEREDHQAAATKPAHPGDPSNPHPRAKLPMPEEGLEPPTRGL